jgi:hypothetical protein
MGTGLLVARTGLGCYVKRSHVVGQRVASSPCGESGFTETIERPRFAGLVANSPELDFRTYAAADAQARWTALICSGVA